MTPPMRRAVLLALAIAAALAAPAYANVAPFAQNSFERVAWRVGVPLDFDATPSTDPDGTIVRYEWDLDGDGAFELSGADLVKPTHTYGADGTFIAQLRVTDDAGATGTSEIEVNVYTVDRVEILSAPQRLTRRRIRRGFAVEGARNHAGFTRDISFTLVCGQRPLAHGVVFVTGQESNEMARGTATVKPVWRRERAALRKLTRPRRCWIVAESDGAKARRLVRVRP